MTRHYFLTFSFSVIMMFAPPAVAKTLIVEGKLVGDVTIKKNVTFSVDQSLSTFTYQFSVPAIYNNAGNVQRLDNFRVTAIPEPTEVTEVTDQYGNRSRKLIWNKLQGDAQVYISYTAGISAIISPRTSAAAFPMSTVPQSEQFFLKQSKLVQSEAPAVVSLAAKLTNGATSEHQVVSAIIDYVADSIKYKYNPKQYDALFGLTTGTGNCQNSSHLAVALLRASGIPARVSIGQTLKDKWKIPLDNKGSSLVQAIGEGLHAWIEVWYPDLGWLPCDPQQSRLFTSTRHIKFGHGLDASDILEYWSAAPVVPRMTENMEATYSTDTVELHLRETLDRPDTYLIASQVTEVLPGHEKLNLKPQPLLTSQAPKKILATLKPVPPKQNKTGKLVEVGNRDFPALVDMYKVDGNVGLRSFDRETAEYVTSKHLYAQAFTVDSPLTVKDVALAMRKFGGDGTIYIDIVRDLEGKPSLDGVRSIPVSLEVITRKPGYYWVDFKLPENTKLTPGKHWLILRHSGEVIMNWFYTPGKRVNGPDDSRSTARGWQWEDVLAGEFVYRVRGVVGD